MKILIIHTAFIGDIVLSTPLIQRLKDMYPESEIDYLTLPTNKSVISNNPNLNEIILYDKKGQDKGIKGFLRVLKILKQKKYDYAVIPHRFIKSILLAKLAKIPNIVGFDVATGSFLLNKKVHYDMKKHEVERLLDLVEYKGEKIPIRIYPAKENFTKINKILEHHGYFGNEGQKLILVAPGSQRAEKMWPIEKYREVIERLKKNKNYFKEMYTSEIEKKWNIDLSAISNTGKTEKRFDFVIKTDNQIYVIETNFYASGGSKLNETARSYKTITREVSTIKGITFVWFTDGIGWKSARHNLEETFDLLEHIYSIDDLENNIISKIIK